MEKLYNKKYVYFEWDDKLKGKECFVSDNINGIKRLINVDYDKFVVNKSDNDAYPFVVNHGDAKFYYNFAYYDPNYEVKKAYIEGKTIQYRLDSSCVWKDVNFKYFNSCAWDYYEFRVKPTDEKIYYVTFPKQFKGFKDSDYKFIINNHLGCMHKFFQGTKTECENWINNHKNFEEVCKSKVEDKTIEYRNLFDPNSEWHYASCSIDEFEPEYYEYRVKPSEEKKEDIYFLSAEFSNGVITATISSVELSNCVYMGSKFNCELLSNVILGSNLKDTDSIRNYIKFVIKGNESIFDSIDKKESISKKTRRMTNRELAKWCAQGNGEVKYGNCVVPKINTFHVYFGTDENMEVGNCYIRKWGSDKWEEPLIEVD